MDDTEVKDETETAGADAAVESGMFEKVAADLEVALRRIAELEGRLAAEDGVGAGGGARRAAVDTSRLSPYEKILFGLGKT